MKTLIVFIRFYIQSSWTVHTLRGHVLRGQVFTFDICMHIYCPMIAQVSRINRNGGRSSPQVDNGLTIGNRFVDKNMLRVGQAFADEIYRVFQKRHSDIRLENEHMNEGARFMIERARN